jgi:hypothetical protein
LAKAGVEDAVAERIVAYGAGKGIDGDAWALNWYKGRGANKGTTLLDQTMTEKVVADQHVLVDLYAEARGLPIPPAYSHPRPTLPAFDGRTTHGVIVPIDRPELGHVPMSSGNANGVKMPYGYADGHGETNTAIWMRNNNVKEALYYHNNPNGICGGCDNFIPSYLAEGSVLHVVSPPNAVPKNASWTAYPKTYRGNALDPFN